MADFSGVRDLAAVLTGGDAIEAAAYDAAQKRLVDRRSAQALMDRRIHQAAQERIAAEALTSLAEGLPAGRDRDLILGKRGSDFASVQRGLGTEQQNLARSAAIEALVNGLDAGTINQLVGIASNKLVTPNNVAVERQAAAQATKDEATAALTNARRTELLPAQVGAAEALTGQRNAQAAYTTARKDKPSMYRASSGSGGLPGATTLAQLFPYDNAGRQPGLDEFTQWWSEQAQVDPAYADFYTAFRAWKTGTLARRPGAVSMADAVSEGFATPMAPAAPVTAPAPAAATAQAEDPGYGNRADAEALIAAAQRKIDAGADPRAVEAILRAELEKRGFTYGTN